MADGQQLTEAEVKAIAELAKLDLTVDEVSMYTNQLSQILSYFESLQEVDTSQVEATASVNPHRSVMRADRVQDALTPDDAIANAPSAEANQFKVSAVLGEE